jgi:predicted metal-dependent hydrolase
VPERLSLPLEDAVELAQRYLDSGRPFHAHEVLEVLWKSRPDEERDLWQGLAQLAVGLTHAMRGNPTGAIALLQRGDDRLRRYVGDRHGIAVDAITATAQATIDRLSADAPHVDPAAFRLR